MEKLSDIYTAMYRAMIDKDIAALGQMLDDSFVLLHMTGVRQSKSAYLQAIADGTLNYYSCTDTMTDIDEDGCTAHITGRSKVVAAVFGSCRTSGRCDSTSSLPIRTTIGK